jgi:hypothetical protein
VFDRCVKKEKCLYLHKGFPCKYYHTGLDCKDDRDTCKFSHEPLNDMTRNLLLKVCYTILICVPGLPAQNEKKIPLKTPDFSQKIPYKFSLSPKSP